MENETQEVNPTQKPPTNPTLETPPLKPKSKLLLFVGGVLLLLLVGGGGYYLGTQSNNTLTKTEQNALSSAPTKPLALTSTPTNQQTNPIPNDWIVKTTNCGVTFSMPPNKEPYVEYFELPSRPQVKWSWEIIESDEPESQAKDSIFTKMTTITYDPNVEKSGYIPGRVDIYCSPNTSYTLTNIVESYASGFGTNSEIKIENKSTTKLWGKDVIAAKFKDETLKDNKMYFVVTDDKVYKIVKRSDPDRAFVRNTTDQIFNSLQFLD